MYILGFNGSHDASVCLVKDGKLLGTITKERITRWKKHNNGNVKFLIDVLLDRFNVNIEDIDYVSFCDNIISNDPNNLWVLNHNDYNYFTLYDEQKLVDHSLSLSISHTSVDDYKVYLSNKKNGYYINHHIGHGSYVFFTSPYKNSLVLTMDGTYNKCFQWMSGKGSKISVIKSLPDMYISLLYDYASSAILKEKSIFSSGKLMGLSSYGSVIGHVKNSYQTYNTKECDKNFYRMTEGLDVSNDGSKNAANSTQYIFENVIIDTLNNLPIELIKEHDYNLCLSGGSFLNCNVNSLIKSKTKFKNVHISPACGDDGLSVGSALYVTHNILAYPRAKYIDKELIYSGSSYDIPEIDGSIQYDVNYVANEISKGKIVAFYQGQSEFGPRALGNRSILADPRCPKMRDHLNHIVKKREWYRPYGASVLEEYTTDWFDWDGPSPFMLYTCQVRQPELVPAITHIDNSCRIQTVNKETNLRYYELINEFYKITRVPLLLNTSFNSSSEPIAETPEDALKTFNSMKIDILVMEDIMILKKDKINKRRTLKINI